MKKIGRNEPCPCGSGKKFKQCHLGKEEDLFPDGPGDFTFEMSTKITSLPAVNYGRSKEMLDALDIKELTGSAMGIRFIDLNSYRSLDLSGPRSFTSGQGNEGGVIVNMLKTSKSDPENIYLAISPKIADGTLVHQLAHALDYLSGSKLMPGLVRPMSYELEVPVEHLEHPYELGYWLDYLHKKFDVQLDADDTIILYLFNNDMLIKGADIQKQDRFILKTKSDQVLRFLSEHSQEIDALICELPGYIGSRAKKDT